MIHATVAAARSTKNVMDKRLNVPLGIYKHYKGGRYEVIGVALHSETKESLAVYRACEGEHGLWVRPLSMFIAEVVVENATVPRFRFIHP